MEVDQPEQKETKTDFTLLQSTEENLPTEDVKTSVVDTDLGTKTEMDVVKDQAETTKDMKEEPMHLEQTIPEEAQCYW